MQPSTTLPSYQGTLDNGQIPSSVDASKYAPINPSMVPPPTNTPPATSTSNTNSPSSNLADQSDRDALNQVQLKQQEAAKNFADTITNIQNGSIPLSAGEQAQVDGLKQQFDTLIKQQTLENAGANGTANIRGYQTGAAEYDPTFQAKTIGSIVSAGQAKIADLNVKMASAVASLTQSFKDNDIAKIKEAYDTLDAASKERQSQLQKTIDATQQAIKDAQTQANSDREYALQKMMDDNTISYQEKQQALATSQLSETKRHNMQQELVSRETALKGVYNRDSDGTIYDTRTGKVVSGPNDSLPIGSFTPGNSGNPLLDANTKTTASGVPYIDGTNLSGAQATSVQLLAAKMGVPFLGKEGASAINNIQAAKGDFQLISNLVNKLNPNDTFNSLTLGASRLGNTLVHGLENVTQVGTGAIDLGSYNAFKESAIKAIQALASGGSGLRINQAEIATMMSIIPSYNDTKGVAQGKLTKLNAMLDNNEKSLIGEKYYNTYNPADANTYNGVTLPGGTSTASGSTYNGITLPN